MSTKTYHGSCHCKAVTFEADIDLSKGTSKCNCSICWKTRNWGVTIKPDAFRLLTGKDALSDYQFATKSGHHWFCKHCGVRPFGDGNIPEIGGDFVSVNVQCLDGVEPLDLTFQYWDGRHDNWQSGPRAEPWRMQA